MGFSTAGADLLLTTATGTAATAPSARTLRLHTATTPTSTNELSGNGYGAVTFVATAATIATQSGYRRLSMPAAEWFADATSSAQSAQSIGLWHGTTLIYHWVDTITPDNQRVFANAGDVYLEVDLADASWVWTTAGLDRGLQAIRGSAVSAVTSVILEIHSGATPTSANRLTGGGIDGVSVGTWNNATSGAFRRRRQAAISWSTGLTADASAAIASIGMWNGRPESSGALLGSRPTTANMPREDDSVTMAANAFYIGVNAAGTTV